MNNLAALKLLTVAIIAVCTVAAAPPEGLCESTAGSSSELVLRQQLINLFQSGSRLESLPPTHMLYPLRTIPLIATTSYLLMEHDPSMLRMFYPNISKLALERFNDETSTENGLIRGYPYASAENIRLSPAVNSIANLELYSLHLIAARIGAYEDALELLSWSRAFTRAVTKTFYDPARNSFLPVGENGHFIARHCPEQLLPLMLDRDLGANARRSIIKKFTNERRIALKTGDKTQADESLWDDPLIHPVMISLMSNILGSPADVLQSQASGADAVSRMTAAPHTHRYWIEFWKDRYLSRRGLFPSWTVISSLMNLASILERESLLEAVEIERLKTDIDNLAKRLSGDSIDLDSYVKTTATVNRLLAKFSEMSVFIASDAKRFKVVDELKWKRLSPRTGNLITESCSAVCKELIKFKAALSDKLEKNTGIIASVLFPEKPVPVGKKVEFKASLRSNIDSLEISRLYLQIGENRWKVSGDGEKIALLPGSPPFVIDKILPLPPFEGPGIITLPVFFDFMHQGSRVEIHHIENIRITIGYNVSLSLPEGRRLEKGPIPFQIILNYQPNHDIQGVVEGTMLEALTCSPELPARFLVRKGTKITTLPLEITPKIGIPPGRYPLSLSVLLDGRTIASFEEKVVRPFKWFHLGPLSNPSWVMKNATEYQDDLFKTHSSPDGRELRWKEVPQGAIGSEGAVLPERLYGKNSSLCFLLYTAIEAPSQLKCNLTLESGNISALWINGIPILPAFEGKGGAAKSPLEFRKGLNSILIASSWTQAPGPVSFELSDDGGLPVSGISNEIDRIIDGFHKLAGGEYDKELEPEPADRLHEVVLRLDYPQALEVCVIGSFNNWDPGTEPMEKDETGLWIAKILLEPGRYPYKFLIDRKTKITDPSSKVIEPDGFGGLNSILVVR